VKRRSLLAATTAWLAACATNTSPDQRRRDLTAAEIVTVDPGVLRAAVLVDARVLVQAVVIELREKGQPERFLIRLQQPAAIDRRLAPAPSGRGWQVFALTADGTSTLLTVRQLLLSRAGGPEGIAVSVAAQPAMVPADLVAALPLRIEMLVDNGRGWFTLSQSTVDLRR
jgi:hypothetical protein